MKVYITGATGFIGRNLKEHFLSKNVTVYTHAKGDDFQILNYIEPDYIFHCAAELRDQNKMFNSNVKLTCDLLEATKEINYKNFIYLSSSITYGEKSKSISEKDLLEPSTIYGATKAAGDLLCQAHAKKYNKNIKIIRLFSGYGRYEKSARFIPTLYDRSIKDEMITISEGVHDFIYIDDIIRFIGLIAFGNFEQTIFNLGTGIMTSNFEVLKMFEKVIGKKIRYQLTDEKLREYDVRFCSCNTTLLNEIGFIPKYTLRTGLIEYINERAKCK